jgi:hypothetical protein
MRETQVMQMKASGVVDGLQRYEVPDCCDVCSALNGKIYKFDEPKDDFHPNCRGCYIPFFNK